MRLFWFKHLHNIQHLRDRDFENFDLPWFRCRTASCCWRTSIASVVAYSVASRYDPADASFRTRCRRGEAEQTGSRTLVSLSIELDNESNVLASRNPHSAVNTKLFDFVDTFSVKLILSWSILFGLFVFPQIFVKRKRFVLIFV